MPDADLPPDIPQEPNSQDPIGVKLAGYEERVARLEAALERDELSHEWKARDLLIAEIRQRILMRRVAVWTALFVMVFMAVVLMHATHSFFWGRFVVIPQAIAIAMFIGPIVSITTLAVVLMVGAFRRFKEEDMNNVSIGSLAAEATRNSMSSS